MDVRENLADRSPDCRGVTGNLHTDRSFDMGNKYDEGPVRLLDRDAVWRN